MSSSARLATSPTTPRVRSPAASRSTPPRSPFRRGGRRARSPSARRGSASTRAAIVGNFGGGRFFDYTAYGDTINTASRLESANKPLGTRICVSRAVVDRAETFCGRPIGDLLLRGKHDTLRAFEPLAESVHAAPETALYLDAFAKLEAGDAAAMPAFAALVGHRPDDRLAGFHLKRLLNGATGTRIELG